MVRRQALALGLGLGGGWHVCERSQQGGGDGCWQLQPEGPRGHGLQVGQLPVPAHTNAPWDTQSPHQPNHHISVPSLPLAQTCLLYFTALFQLEWVVKTMERSRKQHTEG